MREIIFDTETTGLDPREDRIIEIGCIELNDHFPTGRTLHLYLNPINRKVHPDALAIHGITDEFLADKPSFADVADQILEFFSGARWVAHNAAFDISFVNAELARLGLSPIMPDQVSDTLTIARRKHPMGPNSLDALCRRYGIDNSHRTKHGALLDSELLAEVYIELIGGRQAALGLVGSEKRGQQTLSHSEEILIISSRPRPLAPRLTAEDRQAHQALVKKLGENSVWSLYLP